MNIEPLGEGHVEAALDLIVAEQSDLNRACSYLGTTRDGIAGELADLENPWTQWAVVGLDEGRLVGVAFADVDEELGRSWVHGPWLAGDDEAWRRDAPRLLAAVLDALPEGVEEHELCGDVVNARLAWLAEHVGWPGSEPNHVFVADSDAATGWPADDPRLRPARADDAAAIAPLHDAEFPDTYYSATRLVAEAEAGEFVVLVAEDDGFAGYASGRVQGDGAGYLDFIAVPAGARGRGLGRALVVAAGRELMARSPQRNVNLTVQDHREPAKALYRSLGFRPDGVIVGYRPAP